MTCTPNLHVYPDVPRNFQGCRSCACGQALGHFGLIEEDPVLEAQKRAGEEDQTRPGWDFGA